MPLLVKKDVDTFAFKRRTKPRQYLVDDFVLPGVGQELVVPLVIAAPNAEEGVGTEGEEPEEQNQNLEKYTYT